MGNTINNNYNYLFGNVGSTDKAAPGAGRKDAKAAKEKDSFAQSASSVELSGEGLAALARQRTQAASEAEDGMKSSEEKLSPKAQAHLAKLREKYGDFDFVVAESIDNPEALTKDSTKEYSVILTRAELEKMAEDEAHSDKVMKQVTDAVDMTKRIEEKLGDDVRFRHISIAFDDEGHMKLFAELEKLSEKQKERLEAAKEKKAEEKEAAEKPDKEKDEDEEPPWRVRLEATSEEELMEKILGIDWEQIMAE